MHGHTWMVPFTRPCEPIADKRLQAGMGQEQVHQADGGQGGESHRCGSKRGGAAGGADDGTIMTAEAMLRLSAEGGVLPTAPQKH